ncbi:VOC family protein [Fictibacillus phosphorivorans]|uniref:Glyoxalase n=1 Tax=Fictibacillus phosphorivorans TaxID=1221500 RepID=A0A160IKA9_9BACL|nr:VOC family protein [Fictibacillus phosphorivorans]ANC76553.1 glyoxalase [Fictibacillus phosphorivorans]MQR96857.1 VOC family protein [Fictibacillus phosphorivorans]
MITGIEHTGIMVSNMEESIKFYTEVLGLDLLDRFDHTSVPVELAFLGVEGKVLVELIAGYTGPVTNEGKVHHIAFSVQNIEEQYELLQKKDVVMKDKEITELPNGKYFFFFGPDEESLEFFESK